MGTGLLLWVCVCVLKLFGIMLVWKCEYRENTELGPEPGELCLVFSQALLVEIVQAMAKVWYPLSEGLGTRRVLNFRVRYLHIHNELSRRWVSGLNVKFLCTVYYKPGGWLYVPLILVLRKHSQADL